MNPRITIAALCVAVLACPCFGQTVRPFKDLVFSQVAAGGGYESWITVTNRGTDPYNGNLSFYRAKAEPWSPIVDGVTVVNGRLALSVPAGATRTLKITGGATTQSGFAAFVASSFSLTSLLEGNLTYFVRSGNTVTDSVGVTSSTEFYLSSLPFEDFLTIALALVCTTPGPQGATIQVSLFSQSNDLVAAKSLNIGQNEQWVRFLWEEFGRLPLGRGRLEIRSDVPITGTALMFVSGQFSSLPLMPTVRIYNMTVGVNDQICRGQLILWAEGAYFKGYFNVTEVPGVPAVSFQMPVFGLLAQSMLKLVFYAPPTVYGSPEGVGFTTTSIPFSFDAASADSTYIVGSLRKGKGNFGVGLLTLTRIN